MKKEVLKHLRSYRGIFKNYISDYEVIYDMQVPKDPNLLKTITKNHQKIADITEAINWYKTEKKKNWRDLWKSVQ